MLLETNINIESISDLRKNFNVPIKKMCSILEISSSYLYILEKSPELLKVKQLFALSTYFNISVIDLIQLI